MAESSFVKENLYVDYGRTSTDISRLSNLFGDKFEQIRKMSNKSDSLYSDDVLQSTGIIRVSRRSGIDINRISKLSNPQIFEPEGRL